MSQNTSSQHIVNSVIAKLQTSLTHKNIFLKRELPHTEIIEVKQPIEFENALEDFLLSLIDVLQHGIVIYIRTKHIHETEGQVLIDVFDGGEIGRELHDWENVVQFKAHLKAFVIDLKIMKAFLRNHCGVVKIMKISSATSQISISLPIAKPA
jgi:hypothetical protein